MIQRIMIADYNQLLNTPIINQDLTLLSPSTASTDKIYHHIGASGSGLEHNSLYRTDGTQWINFDASAELQNYQPKLTAGSGITIVDNIISASGVTAGAIQVNTKSELPTAGDRGGVYFVLDERATYCWDGTQYICVGQDYEYLTLNGGTALSE